MTDSPPMPSSAPGRPPGFDELTEVGLAAEALERLLADDHSLADLEDAVHNGNPRAFAAVLENLQLLDHLPVICRWICSWYVQRRCLWLCRDIELTAMSEAEGREATLGFAKLAATEDALDKLVETMAADDDTAFHQLLEEFGLHHYCRFVCVLVLTVKCELFCIGLDRVRPTERPRPLVPVLRDLAAASAALASDEQVFQSSLQAYRDADYDKVHQLLDRLQLIRFCHLVCWWFCVLVPYLRCLRVCLELGPLDPDHIPKPGDPGPLRDWAQVSLRIGSDRELANRLLRPALSGDDQQFLEQIRSLDLLPWCHYLCWWFLRLQCYRRCFFICPPRPPLPYFYKLGGYDYTSQVDSGAGGTGLTLGDQRAFYGTVRLNGSPLQKSYDGGRPEYRFEVFQSGSWTPVLAGQIAPTPIGSWTQAGLVTPKSYVVNGAPAPNVIPVAVKPDGWIEVPTADNYWGAEGYFGPTGDYLMLNTATVVAGVAHDAGSVDGGDAVPTTELGADHVIGIRMRWRKVGDLSDGLVVGAAASVAVCNDSWDHVAKLGSWVPTRVNGQQAVVSVGISELVTGCNDITDQLHVLYTASHPNLGAVALDLTGPGGFTLAMTDDGAATPDNRFGVAEVNSPNGASDLFPCTYIVTLRASLLLTTGDAVPDPLTDTIGFHKA
ncbi:MAG TPA: hypothetical protein VFJ97_01585 [Dermatophilaceae bacterium]|nr:hypothetical protein [Dermatophilaceae bacterium]